MTAGSALLLRADARRLPLADESVDLCVTSPPYLWKRKYAIDGDGEMGNERDWREYLDGLFAVTDELLRVLKSTGSIFVDLGDTRVTGTEPKWLGVPIKSRLLLPERYRVGCQDRYLAQGVIVRQVQIWEKANGLPESVEDRTRDSHEDFVHLVKQPRYYSAVDEVREGYAPIAGGRGINGSKASGIVQPHRIRADVPNAGIIGERPPENPLGKLPGSVWNIPSEPLQVPAHLGIQHYAAFPSELPRRLILGWSPPGICTGCGQGRVPVVDRELTVNRKGQQSQRISSAVNGGATGQTLGWERETSILGYACACTPHTRHEGTGGTTRRDYNPVPDARPQGTYGRHQAGEYDRVGSWTEYHLDGWHPPPARPAVVLDPFCGTGTTPMVARALGRHGVGVDLSADYLRLATWRVWHSGSWQDVIARTTGRKLPKLRPHDPAQGSLIA